MASSTPLQVPAGDVEVARPRRADGQQHGVVPAAQLVGVDGSADLGVEDEAHALGLHLLDAALDVLLVHLEVGDAVRQQPAGRSSRS